MTLEQLAGVVASLDSLASKMTGTLADLVKCRDDQRAELDGYRVDVQACTRSFESAAQLFSETVEGWKAHTKRTQEATDARFGRIETEIGVPAPENAPREGTGINGTLSVLVRDMRSRGEVSFATGASRTAVGLTGAIGGGGGAALVWILNRVLGP